VAAAPAAGGLSAAWGAECAAKPNETPSMKRLLLRTLINTISRYPTGLPYPTHIPGKNRQPSAIPVIKPGHSCSFSWGSSGLYIRSISLIEFVTILLKQFYHRRIATQLQITWKNRLISIDLIKVNSGNYGQLVDFVPSGNTAILTN
jgi:hypothetical protein